MSSVIEKRPEAVAQKYDAESGLYFVALKTKPGLWPTGPGRYYVDVHDVNETRSRSAGFIGPRRGTVLSDLWFGNAKAALKSAMRSNNK